MKLPTRRSAARRLARRAATHSLPVAGVIPLLLIGAGAALAHLALATSEPAAGAELDTAPTSVRLEFTRAIQLPFTEISVTGPRGEVELGPPALVNDSAHIVHAAVTGPLEPGVYTVAWRVAGSDGHPIRGEYGFRLADAGAASDARSGVAPAGPGSAGAGPTHASDAPAGPSAGRAMPRSGRPQISLPTIAFGVTRYITFAALLALIGAVAFRSLVLPSAVTRGGVAEPAVAKALAGGAARFAGAAAWLLLGTAAVRIYLQSAAVGIGMVDLSRIRGMLLHTPWGWGWLLQVAGAVAALAGMRLVVRHPRTGWVTAGAGAMVAAVSPALSGHAVAAPELTPLAVVADALHVTGAGGWLGTLLVIILVGGSVIRTLPAADRGAAARALVVSFSPAALAFASILVATGAFATWLHLQAVEDLWRTSYGRTLLVKLAFLLPVFAAGAYNWRRATPALGDASSVDALHRSAAVELGSAALVLAATAVLVATPPPTPPSASGSAAPAAARDASGDGSIAAAPPLPAGISFPEGGSGRR